MRKYLIVSLCFLFVMSLFCCGDSGTNSRQIISYFRGTVYVGGTPTPNVRVKIELRDSSKYIGGLTWDVSKEVTTESDGTFELKYVENISEPHGWTWRAQAKHPTTGDWSNWVYGGTVTEGESGAGTLVISLD